MERPLDPGRTLTGEPRRVALAKIRAWCDAEIARFNAGPYPGDIGLVIRARVALSTEPLAPDAPFPYVLPDSGLRAVVEEIP